jgi:sugar phosphate isomerase/epimerase
MARSITLCTCQWADLSLETLAPMAKSFGFDGLELACFGDHFEVDKVLADPDYCDRRRAILKQHGLRCFSRPPGTRDLPPRSTSIGTRFGARPKPV